MQPQIITVHNIERAIEDVGVLPYANTLVRETSGEYFYVEAELFEQVPVNILPNQRIKEEIMPDDSMIKKCWWVWSVWPVPMRLAWFIIDALRLKSQAANIGNNGYQEDGKVSVYITPGTEFMGKVFDKVTEIPAELRPVVVEKL